MGQDPGDKSDHEQHGEDVQPVVSPLYPDIGIEVVMREEISLADIEYPEIGLEEAPRRSDTDAPE